MNGKVRIAVAGAGLIGRRHVEEVDASPVATLAAIVDPGPVTSTVPFDPATLPIAMLATVGLMLDVVNVAPPLTVSEAVLD